VTGKENLLFAIAEASLDRPDDPVKEVVYPAVAGGEQTLRELVHEFKTKGPVYRRTVQTKLKASYSNHYRRGLAELLDVLEFRSNNATHRPVLDALELITRHADARLTYYPAGESIPSHKRVLGDWTTLVYKDVGKGGRRVVRSVYEICTFQALRERLRCKEIWVVGADKWRNPDEDLPHGFEAEAGLAAHGLSRARATVVWLVHRGGPQTQRELARAIGVTARNVTALVDGLEESGFVRRTAHPEDRRALRVQLTEQGSAVTAGLAADYEQHSAYLFAEIPANRCNSSWPPWTRSWAGWRRSPRRPRIGEHRRAGDLHRVGRALAGHGSEVGVAGQVAPGGQVQRCRRVGGDQVDDRGRGRGGDQPAQSSRSRTHRRSPPLRTTGVTRRSVAGLGAIRACRRRAGPRDGRGR
jgi:DNA-binding MarR family transcriptional regulator